MMSKDAAPPNQGAPGSEPSDAAVLATLQRIAARQTPLAAASGRPQPATPDPPAPSTAAPASAKSPSESREPSLRRRRLGEILLDEGLVTKEQIEAALKLQAEARPGVPVGQLLVYQGAITQRQLGAILDKYRLGNFLVETNVITEQQLETALQRQKRTNRPLGNVLVQLGFLTEPQLRQALATQLGIPFVDLDKLTLDPELSQVIDRDYAQRHRVVPISRTADRVTIAMDDPADYSVIGALWVSAACKIDVVTATGAALRRAFGRVYGGRPVPPPPAALDDPAMRELRERHTETIRRLTALRAASERVRHDLDVGARLLQGIERPSGEPTPSPAGPPPTSAPGTPPRRPRATPPPTLTIGRGRSRGLVR
jgi:MshEN domain